MKNRGLASPPVSGARETMGGPPTVQWARLTSGDTVTTAAPALSERATHSFIAARSHPASAARPRMVHLRRLIAPALLSASVVTGRIGNALAMPAMANETAGSTRSVTPMTGPDVLGFGRQTLRLDSWESMPKVARLPMAGHQR